MAEAFESMTLRHLHSHGCRDPPEDLLIPSLCPRMGVCALWAPGVFDRRGPMTNKRHGHAHHED